MERGKTKRRQERRLECGLYEERERQAGRKGGYRDSSSNSSSDSARPDTKMMMIMIATYPWRTSWPSD